MKTKPLRMSYNFDFPSVLSLANRCHAMMMTLEQNMTTHSIYKHLLPVGAVQHTHSLISFEPSPSFEFFLKNFAFMTGTGSVVITGASGLLGRALMTKFQESGLFEKVVGTALNR